MFYICLQNASIMRRGLITGSSEGIGLEIAKRLAAEGYAVTLNARNQDKLDSALNGLTGSGHKTLCADLSTNLGLDKIKSEVSSTHYDVFVNNAGFGIYGRFEELDIVRQLHMMKLNMNALTILSHYYLGQAKSGDALINIASTLGETSLPGAAAYAATKSYVIDLSNALWAENLERGIYVCGFCPGATKTKFHEVSGGSTSDIPSFILQEPKDVASDLIRALRKRKKPRVISGFINQMMVAFYRLTTNRVKALMMANLSPTK